MGYASARLPCRRGHVSPGMRLHWYCVYTARTEPQVWSSVPQNLNVAVAVHTCNLSYQEVEAGGPEVQGHPWPHSEFEISWGYTKLCLKNKEERKKRTLKMKGTLGVLDYCWQAGRRGWKVSSVQRTRYFSNIFGHMVSKNFFIFIFFCQNKKLVPPPDKAFVGAAPCEFMLGAFGR